MLSAMRHAISASMTVYTHEDKEAVPLNHHEAFYLATQGGANLLNLGDEIGNFEVGKQFDALIVDPYVANSPYDVFPTDDLHGTCIAPPLCDVVIDW